MLNSVAIGRNACAIGPDSIALGANVVAEAGEIVIGPQEHVDTCGLTAEEIGILLAKPRINVLTERNRKVHPAIKLEAAQKWIDAFYVPKREA